MMEYIGIAAVILIVIIIGLAIAFEKGLIWLSPERIRAIHAKGDALQAKWEAKLAQKSVAPTRTKAQRIADAQAVLAAGAITQADFEAAKVKILLE